MGVLRRGLPTMLAGLLVLGLTLNPLSHEEADAACGTWTRVTSADFTKHYNGLYGIAAAGNGIWAVGSHNWPYATEARTLTERWNGTAWKTLPSPNVGGKNTANELRAVSAVSATDVWAVGAAGLNPLIEHWNGTAWSVVPGGSASSASTLLGVATIATDDVWAVGYQSWRQRSLAEHWDGNTWTSFPVPWEDQDGSTLNAITAVSSSDVWAVGEWGDGNPFFAHWDGVNWQRDVSLPFELQASWVTGIDALSANDIWAVGVTYDYGEGRDMAATWHWDGLSWSVVPAPTPGHEAYFNGVTATSASDVWAVGYQYTTASTGSRRTLIEHWDGANWTVVTSPNPNRNGELNAVATATASTTAWTAGLYWNTKLAKQRTLVAKRC